MKKIFYFLFLIFSFLTSKASLYSSPGTGVNWTLSDLVANSGGIVTFDGTAYTFTDSVTIKTGDILRIETDATVKFNPLVVFRVNGTIIINPPTAVLFTAVNAATPYRGIWLESSSNSSIKKLTYEYASSFRLSDSSPEFENCIFRYNNSSTTLSNGTLSLFRSSPVIRSCSFIDNYRAAIQGGANIANAPKILNCTFIGNNTLNQNVPHINLGASGTDTTKIIGCSITNPGGIRTGAIGFLPLGNLNTLIEHNHIANNRYGINLLGGSAINAMVRYNYFGFNNIENNPNLGGSGIAFGGGAAGNHQNSIVTGNIFEGNLWGITIQNRAKPNLGNLNNTDTSDNGKNYFINNTNNGVPFIDLYNNSADSIFAQGNFWNSEIETEVENKIFHKNDQASLGTVVYLNYASRFNLISFNGTLTVNDVYLNWSSLAEFGTDSYIVEKSLSNTGFEPIDTVAAKNIFLGPSEYSSIDAGAYVNNSTVYYRLKMIDTTGGFRYSNTVTITFPNIPVTGLENYYPTILNSGQPWTIKVNSPYKQFLRLGYFTTDGKLVKVTYLPMVSGYNEFKVPTDARLPKGWVYIKVYAIGLKKTIPVLIH